MATKSYRTMKLRRQNRAISEDKALDLLKKSEYGVLSTVTKEGLPYGVPLNFCVIDNYVYFHFAVEGQKIKNIEHNNEVSFCVVGRTEIMSEKFSTKYESAIVFGEIEEFFDEKKEKALVGLVRKYSPDFIDKGKKYIENSMFETRVFGIKIDTLTGKARK